MDNIINKWHHRDQTVDNIKNIKPIIPQNLFPYLYHLTLFQNVQYPNPGLGYWVNNINGYIHSMGSPKVNITNINKYANNKLDKIC